jgi:hypothetical protein
MDGRFVSTEPCCGCEALARRMAALEELVRKSQAQIEEGEKSAHSTHRRRGLPPPAVTALTLTYPAREGEQGAAAQASSPLRADESKRVRIDLDLDLGLDESSPRSPSHRSAAPRDADAKHREDAGNRRRIDNSSPTTTTTTTTTNGTSGVTYEDFAVLSARVEAQSKAVVMLTEGVRTLKGVAVDVKHLKNALLDLKAVRGVPSIRPLLLAASQYLWCPADAPSQLRTMSYVVFGHNPWYVCAGEGPGRES